MQKSFYLGVSLAGLLFLFFSLSLVAFSSDMQLNTAVSASADGVWIDGTVSALQIAGKQQIQASAYRTIILNEQALRDILANAPLEFTVAHAPVILTLPLPDGQYGRFYIVESPIMAPELAAKFPDIKTYAGRGVDDPTASTRFDVTPLGFHGLVMTPNGRVFIDPLTDQTTAVYMSYYSKNFIPDAIKVNQITEEVEQLENNLANNKQVQTILSNGITELRTFRLALAATGEYTQRFGSKANAIAQMTTSLNRVNEVYMRDLAIKLELIDNNDSIVYKDSLTDPYTTNYLSQNQSNLDATIGNANYDIGHVLTTGSGGIASLGVVCKTNSKARGTTGLPNPVGDPFDIDYLSHEIGHQFSATHTFNGTSSNCAGNRTGSTAFEPGSGSTIMGYAGICGPDNLQAHSDPFFHSASILQINNYLATQNCQSNSGVNNAPTANAGDDFTIPQNTPFTLTGSGSDVESTALTYSWEEFDLGAAGNVDNPLATASPIFRFFPPTTTATRIFPQLSDILNNTQTIGEILPQVGRTLNFKLTVRDNQMIGATDADDMRVTVDSSSGPFRITSFNTAVSLPPNTQQTITWDVANTDSAPVNCTHVNIYISDNGGVSFWETAVAPQTPNDGTALITIPLIAGQNIRFKIQCHDNIFFDINDANLTIATETLYLPIIFAD